MKLFIVGTGFKDNVEFAPNYRGADRSTPYFCDSLPERHLVNQFFLWFVGASSQDGTVSDLVQAQALVTAYADLEPPQYFEILELTTFDTQPETESSFLGFDVFSFRTGASLLSHGIGNCPQEIDNYQPTQKPRLQPFNLLICLSERFFEDKLNEHGLFNDNETAQLFLEVVTSLQKIQAHYWHHETEFEILGLWKVIE